MATRAQQIAELQTDWDSNPRWAGITRAHSAEDVVRLRGSLQVEHTLARRGALRLWELLRQEPFVNALGAQGGHQALQQVRAGLKALYLSGQEQPTPALVRGVNAALRQADQAQWAEGRDDIDYYAPIVAGAQAGDAYAQMSAMIEAGAAGVHVEDQRAGVLMPTRAAVQQLGAARLAADVLGVATLLIARTDAASARLLSSDVDDNDRPFCHGERTPDGHHPVNAGLEAAVARALAYAPHADLLWCETARPDLLFAQQFAAAVHAVHPGKMLAYHCSPSFNWKQNLDDATIARFQTALGAMGYRFQFVTQAGAHAQNYGMFSLAHGYARRQMAAFVELQEAEFAAAEKGFSARKVA